MNRLEIDCLSKTFSIKKTMKKMLRKSKRYEKQTHRNIYETRQHHQYNRCGWSSTKKFFLIGFRALEFQFPRCLCEVLVGEYERVLVDENQRLKMHTFVGHQPMDVFNSNVMHTWGHATTCLKVYDPPDVVRLKREGRHFWRGNHLQPQMKYPPN